MSNYLAKSLPEVARFLGVDETTVKQFRQETPPLPGERGAYPLDEITRWYIARLRAQVGTTDRQKMELAKLATEVEMRQVRLSRLKGEVVDRRAAAAEVRQMFNRIKCRLENLPDELASSIPPAKRADVLAQWRGKIRLVQMELAQFAE